MPDPFDLNKKEEEDQNMGEVKFPGKNILPFIFLNKTYCKKSHEWTEREMIGRMRKSEQIGKHICKNKAQQKKLIRTREGIFEAHSQ